MPTTHQVWTESLLRMPALGTWTLDNRLTCARVARYLTGDIGTAQADLQNLEAAMIAEINNRLANAVHAGNIAAVATTFQNRNTPRPFGAPQLPAHLRGVLTAVLTANETNHGFQLPVVNGAPVAPTFFGFVPPTAFRGQIRQGRPFKDPSVPGGHGEFTHRIQWYLITNSGAVQAPAIGWGNFYRWIGSQFHRPANAQPATDPPAWAALGLWDALLDRNMFGRNNVNGPYNTAAVTDFRSPENLHRHIRQQGAAHPILSGFIEGRHRKRENSGLLSPQAAVAEAAMVDYLSRKIYAIPRSQLPLVDRAALVNMIQNAANNNVLMPAQPIAPSAESNYQTFLRKLYDALGW